MLSNWKFYIDMRKVTPEYQDYKNLVNCKCLPMKFITCQIFKKKHNFNKLLIESLQKMLEEKLCF